MLFDRFHDGLQAGPCPLHNLVGVFRGRIDPRALARDNFLPRRAQFGRLIVRGDVEMQLNALTGSHGCGHGTQVRAEAGSHR
jgi:hypothetical protein